MAYEQKPVILKWDKDPGDLCPMESSFETVLGRTFERLGEKYAEYAIRRIREMDEELEGLEKELDEFMEPKVPEPKVPGSSHAKSE